MPAHPTRLLRGLLKLIGVVLAAGLAGAAIGIGLAKLGGEEDTSPPVAPVTTEQALSTTTIQTQTTPASSARRILPGVRVLQARLGPPSAATGRAIVAVRVRVTNRDSRPLTVRGPVLLSGTDEVALGPTARPAAAGLLRTLDAGESATGVLRFSIPRVVAQRLAAAPRARLGIAKRMVKLLLKTDADFAAP